MATEEARPPTPSFKIARLFSDDGPPPLLQSLYDMADPLTSLALAHSCKTYKTLHDKYERSRPLQVRDIQLDARFPDRVDVRVPAVERYSSGDKAGKHYVSSVMRPATKFDLGRPLVSKPEFSFYSFEEYRCPKSQSPVQWYGDDTYGSYKGVVTKSGCTLLKGRGVSDSMFGNAVVETWRLPYGRSFFSVEDIAQIIVGRYCSSPNGPEHLRYSTYWTELEVPIKFTLIPHIWGPFPLAMEDFADRQEPDAAQGDLSTNPVLRTMMGLASDHFTIGPF